METDRDRDREQPSESCGAQRISAEVDNLAGHKDEGRGKGGAKLTLDSERGVRCARPWRGKCPMPHVAYLP
jgi:hypothetical protein